MPDLLVSYFIESPVEEPHGQRIWTDGKVENFRTSRYVKGSDGNYHDQPITPDWYDVATLSQNQVEAIRKAIAGSNLADLPPRLSEERDDNDDYPETAKWQFLTDDNSLRTVIIDNWSPATSSQRPLLQLVQQMGDIVLTAQSGSSAAP